MSIEEIRSAMLAMLVLGLGLGVLIGHSAAIYFERKRSFEHVLEAFENYMKRMRKNGIILDDPYSETEELSPEQKEKIREWHEDPNAANKFRSVNSK